MSNEVLLQTGHMPIAFHLPHVNEMLKSKYRAVNLQKTTSKNDSHMSVELADTAGWDMVYVTRISELNERIRRQHISPANFNSSFSDEDTGLSGEIRGSFGDWQISKGGYGRFLRMIIPVANGEIIMQGKSFSLDGYKVLAQVDLETFSQADTPLEVKVVSVQPSENSNMNEVISSIVFYTFEVWLNSNPHEFTNILAIESLGLVFSEEWLKPTYTSCAYVEGKDDNDSFFGLLSMTENRGTEDLRHRLPSTAIPEGKKALLMLGDHRVIEKAFLPQMMSTFKNNACNLLKMTNANTQISLAEDTIIPLGEVCVEGITYIPQVTMLDAGMEDNEVKTIIRIKVSISQGVDAFIDMTTYQVLEFAADPAAKQISFREIRDPDIAYNIDASVGVDMTKADIENITAIVDAAIQTYIGLSPAC